MSDDTLYEALEREHREIDAGIEAFAAPAEPGDAPIEALKAAVSALRRHIYLEEEFLFPPLRATGLMAPVFVMLREHGEMWRLLDALESQVEADGGAGSTHGLVGLTEQLVPRLEAHNLKEEAILYSQADRVVTGDAADRLRAFLESGRMPPGWVCAQAGA